MRCRVLLIMAFFLTVVAAVPASAQLVGTDTAPGDSCAGYAAGVTRYNADPDLDGANVVLICDGTTWNAMADGGLPSCSDGEVMVWNNGGWVCAHNVGQVVLADQMLCWGSGRTGALGDGNSDSTMSIGGYRQLSPVMLDGAGGWNTTRWKTLASGGFDTKSDDHTCAIRSSDDRLFCWGNGGGGRLGNGLGNDQTVPTALDSTGGWDTTAWSAVATGHAHTCAIRSSDSRMFCWGNGGNGRLGTGNGNNVNVPTALDSGGGWDITTWSAVAAGDQHTCGIRSSDSRIFCWGNGGGGRLGTGNENQQLTPTALDSTGGWDTTAWSAVSVGQQHTCAIRASDSRTFCWGNGGNGRLGTGNGNNVNVPTALDSGGGWDITAWSAVAAGINHTCAIRASDSRTFCWGNGDNGRLGTGNENQQLTPTALDSTGGWDTTAWSAVSAQSAHTCAVRASDSRIFCWGRNYTLGGEVYAGQLGDGTETDRLSPTALDSAGGWDSASWKSVSSGGSHTCAIKK